MRQQTHTLILVLAIALSVQGQSTDLKSKTKTFRNSKRFSIEYDKFKDQTTASVGSFAVSGKKGVVGLYARFLFPGQKVDVPVDRLYLGIVTYGREWKFLSVDTVYMLIDGERLQLAAHRGSRLGSSRAYITEEWLLVPLEHSTFARLVNSKSVEIKAGQFEIVLNDEHQVAFRDLLSLARPSE